MPNTKGYVLIEFMMEIVAVSGLIVVMSLIGVQSTIAVQSLAESRTESHFAAMKWDLEKLAERQALHFAEASAFASSPRTLRFTATDGVVVSVTASAGGWYGTASHSALPEGHGCAVFYGSVTPPTAPIRPGSAGEVACTE